MRENVACHKSNDLEHDMPAIGFVIKQRDGSYKGELQTLTIHASIEIRPNLQKSSDRQPDFRVFAASGIEIGSARKKVGLESAKEYIAVQFAVPEFGPRRLSANLGPATGQDKDVLAILWNPES